MRKAISYTRVSTGRQASDGGGLQRQLDDAQLWCERNGYELDTELDLSDAGASAFKGDHLEGALGRLLSLAKNGQLPKDSVLLVESVSRLSRLEVLDGLQDVFLALIRADVVIITLEDGQKYSRQSIRDDSTKLVMLVLKAEAAHAYSKNLSRMGVAAWQQDLEKQRQGIVVRGNHSPFWLDYDEASNSFSIDKAKAAVILRAFELAEQGLGYVRIARQLADEGFKSPRGKLISAPRVRELVLCCEIVGDRRHTQRIRVTDPISGRKRWKYLPEKDEIIPDYFPPLVTRERQAYIRSISASRGTAARGARDSCKFIGQGITTCSKCGTTVGRVAAGSRANAAYVRCRTAIDGHSCGQASLPLKDVHAHLLTRLSRGQLSALFTDASEQDGQISRERETIGQLTTELEALTQRHKTLKDRVVEAAAAQSPLGLLTTLQDAVTDAAEDINAKQAAIAKAKERLGALQYKPSPNGIADELQPQIDVLFKAFADDDDTPEQRIGLNRALKQLGLKVIIDANARKIGLQIGDNEIDWQPVLGGESALALRKGKTGAKSVEVGGEGAVVIKDGETVDLFHSVDAETLELLKAKLPRNADGSFDLSALMNHPELQK